MIRTTILALAGVATGQSPVVFVDLAGAREGVVAERIARPRTTSAEAFADQLVEAGGLVSWSDQDPTRSRAGASPAWRARHAADGREVVVYYAPASTVVCRVTRPRGGASSAHRRAVRWCAAELGVPLSATRPAPVAGR